MGQSCKKVSSPFLYSYILHMKEIYSVKEYNSKSIEKGNSFIRTQLYISSVQEYARDPL